MSFCEQSGLVLYSGKKSPQIEYSFFFSFSLREWKVPKISTKSFPPKVILILFILSQKPLRFQVAVSFLFPG